MTRFSACIEMLFAEEPDFAARIRLARDAGFDAVEFWRWSNKDLPEIGLALAETGLELAGILCEPIADLADPAARSAFLAGVRASRDAARALGAPMMIAQSGNVRWDVPRPDQHRAIVDTLREAAAILAGGQVVLALEPLNDRIDHPGYYLTSTTDGLDIIEQVASPEVRLLYDIYHAAVMDEPIEVLEGRLGLVAHVHLADAPGRHEPGSGALDWQRRLKWLDDRGYTGRIGLEYRPSGPTLDSLAFRHET